MTALAEPDHCIREMPGDRASLDAALLVAHAARDAARLSCLYAEAADLAQISGDATAAGFYLTHAYVFALVAGLPDATRHRAALIACGRDTD